VELTVDDCGVSSKFLRLLSHLNGVTQEIILALGPDTAKEIMRNFIQQIFSEMSNGTDTSLLLTNAKAPSGQTKSPKLKKCFLLKDSNNF
jgi:hypothetical protein